MVNLAGDWMPWLLGVTLIAGCPTPPPMSPKLDAPVTSVPDLSGSDGCGAHDVAALMTCVSEEKFEAVARAVAKPREPGTPHHAAVRELCATRLTELGFETRTQGYGSGTNVIGHKPGFSKPQELVLVGAHYDQVGACNGADDNASGVAAVLEIARVLAPARFDRTLVISCWDEGERGQLGSIAHAEEALEEKSTIKLAVSFEAIGYASDSMDSQRVPDRFEELFPDQALALLEDDYRADFLTVVAETSTERWANQVVTHGATEELSVHILTLTERMKVKQRELHPSDHVSFWDRKYPAMLITDTGPYRNERIGCKKGQDDIDTLSVPFAARATRAAMGAIVDVLELR